ncbi:MAG: formate dehydrogenase subunit delta [Magnetococcales bacterium]|nr:formate dehydrogenase subunit delta [Magnetococcales bacterium]
MNPQHLIKMANQIGTFFSAMPDRAQSAKDVAAHIQRAWEPRMRAELLQHVSRGGSAELIPIVQEALPLIQVAVRPS